MLVRTIITATCCILFVHGHRHTDSIEWKESEPEQLGQRMIAYSKHRVEYDDFGFGKENKKKHDEENEDDFTYDRHDRKLGPNGWGHIWKSCRGHHQSPIDISERRTVYKNFILQFHVERSPYFRGVFLNNGHAPTYQLKQKGSILSGVPGYPREKFILVQFHFHFSLRNNHGSEHSINRRFYAGEMHMVHYNVKYRSFDDAANKPDGLAVVAILFAEGGSKKRHFDYLVERHGKDIRRPSDAGFRARFNPFRMFSATDAAFSYKGSLTTPRCYESVSWVIMKEPVRLHHDTLKAFRHLRTKHSSQCIAKNSNDRPQQPLNRRIVYRNF